MAHMKSLTNAKWKTSKFGRDFGKMVTVLTFNIVKRKKC